MGYGDSDPDPADPAVAGRLNVFDEWVTRELEIIWEHTFQKVNENAGDGITDKFFEYAGVARSGSDVQVNEGGHIQTKESGDYGAGQPVVAGAAGHFGSTPTGTQDGWVGYTDGTWGGGFGEDATSPYVFLDRDGVRTTVHQSDWNLHKLNGEPGEGPPLDATDGFTLRLPHACYGHSKFTVVLGVKLDNGGFKLYPVHQFNVIGASMWDVFDLPIRWQFDGSEGDGNYLAGTACHYEGETGRNVKRTNGETSTAAKNGGESISLPSFTGTTGGWTPLVAFRKRTGWSQANVTPLAFSIDSDNPVEVQITARAALSNTNWQLPEATTTTETAVEYDVVDSEDKASATTIDTLGEREYIDTVPGSNKPIDVSGDLEDVVIAEGDIILLSARRSTGTSTSVQAATLRNGGGF